MSQLNLPHGTNRKQKKNKSKKTHVLRSISKQSGESMYSVLEKKKNATQRRIYRKEDFKPGMKE